jgi:DNA polymerase-3 subunit gamma/tau
MGADPRSIIADLAEFTHFITRLKVVPDTAKDSSVTEVERVRGTAFTGLPMRVLSRAWQMLLKGLQEVGDAPKPIAAAEMLLVRLAYAADLPTPDEALRILKEEARTASSAPSAPAPSGGGARMIANGGLSIAARTETPRSAPQQADTQPTMRITTLDDLVALATEKRDIVIKHALEEDIRLVRIEDGRLEFAPTERAPRDLASDLGRRLTEWTGRRWIVAVSSEKGQKTLREVEDEAKAEKLLDVREHPLVKAVMTQFPGATITEVRDLIAAETVSDVSEDAGSDETFDFSILDDD